MEDLIGLLVQVPIVGLFGYFVIKLQEKVDVAQRERDEQWREFLKSQSQVSNATHDQHMETVKYFAENIEKTNENIEKLCRSVSKQTAVTLYGIAKQVNGGDIKLEELIELLS